MGAEVVGWTSGGPGGMTSIDSFLLATLVETGVPGTVFFFGGILIATWTGLKRYLFGALSRGQNASALIRQSDGVAKPQVADGRSEVISSAS